MSAPAVIVAALAGFVATSIWYAIFGAALDAERARWGDREPAPARPPLWKLALEIARQLVVAAVVAALASETGVDQPGEGALLALCLWIAFPAVILSGSVIWESVPVRLASIHAGDWLLKLLVIGVIVAAWQ